MITLSLAPVSWLHMWFFKVRFLQCFTAFSVMCVIASFNGKVAAQDSTPVQKTNEKAQSKSLELEQVEKNIAKALARQVALREEIARYNDDLGAINRALVQTAKRGQELETDISNTEAELSRLQQLQAGIRNSLSGKRKLLSEVLGALQRMGRNPPPAILVRPEDALASVRSSILLSAVVPDIKTEADALFAKLAALRETSKTIAATKTSLSQQLNALAEDETRLTVLVEEKNQLAQISEADLEEEQRRASELASTALSLKELIKNLESEIASAAAAARSAKDADERRKSLETERLAQAREKLGTQPVTQLKAKDVISTAPFDRIEPAVAFSKSKGALPQPVSGRKLHDFGSLSSENTVNTTIAIETRPNARVRSPLDGWIVYAGSFRSYGNVLILNAGEDYHMVLSGLSEVNVKSGQFVLAGEPVGRMGVNRFAATATPDLGSNRPVLSVELRKDGKPIDPAPWWAENGKTTNQLSSDRSRQEGSDNDS